MKKTTKISFREQMSGEIGWGEQNFKTGAEHGSTMTLDVHVEIDDVGRFLEDSGHTANLTGSLSGPMWPAPLPVQGEFNLLKQSTGDLLRRVMTYRAYFKDPAGEEYTFAGHKDVQDDVGIDVWSDTTTLFAYLLQGHVRAGHDPSAEIRAAGILKLDPLAFVRQLATFRVEGETLSDRVEALGKFGSFFLGSLWEVYGPHLMPKQRGFEREIPLYTMDGVKGAEITQHPFSTADKLGLSLTRFRRAESNDVVMIIHGLTTSTDMFVMPEHYNLVSYLLDHGFTDVFTLDYRMSNRFCYNMHRHRYSMDDIALFDYPPAIERIRELAGDGVRIHIICHCLGAVSFMMSLFGKAVTGIRSVVANSAALTPCVPAWSRIKLRIAPFLAEYILQLPFFSPNWSEEQGLTLTKLFTRVNSFFHRECDVPACHMLSLMWGTGRPALYSHQNLAEITHRRGGDLYGPTSFSYYRHVSKMVESKNTAVKYNPKDARLKALPDDYFTYAREIETPVLLMTGGENRVFADSNIECHRRLELLVPGRHSLKVIPRYGHQDVFMGNRVHEDVFPWILEFINQHKTDLP